MREREGVAGVEAVGVGEVREVMEGRGEAIVDMVEESWEVVGGGGPRVPYSKVGLGGLGGKMGGV